MKKCFIAINILIIFTFCSIINPVTAGEKKEKQNIIVHLTHFTDNLHAAAMALKLAAGLKQKGADTTLLLTLEGVRLVDKNQPLNLKWGQTKDFSVILDNYIKVGGKILVCPHCAMAAGIKAKDIRKGATIAGKKQNILDAIMKADKILDY